MDFQKYSNFMKIHPVGAESFHMDRQTGHTDMTKLTVAFWKFVNVLKKGEGLQPRP
jgi:hypothetical protein